MAQAFDGAMREARERDAGALEHRLPDVRLTDAVARQRRGMLGADDEQRTGREDDVVVPEPGHGADELIENLRPGLAPIGEDVVRRRGADHRHRAGLPGKAGVHMKWNPGAVGLGFGDAGGELSGLAMGRHVGFAGDVAADIAKHQLHRATDRRVSAGALTEEIAARIEIELIHDRSVDDDQRRRGIGGGLDTIELAVVMQQGLDRRQHDREIFGATAGQHRIDGDLLDRGQAPTGRNRSDRPARVPPGSVDPLLHFCRVGMATGRPSVQPRAKNSS